jgi:tripartite-type tricarboxylate transporter receptor subunit TctC
MTKGWRLLLIAVLVTPAARVLPVHAQYPNKVVRMIVPFAAGSVNDLIARIIAPPLAEALGQQVIIDNRAGAAGNVGAELAAKAAADGYTLFLGNISHAISVTLYDKLGYDFLADFAPVSSIGSGAYMLATHPSLPVKSVTELISLAKSRPGDLNVGVGGAGIIIAAELFKSAAGVRMTNVSYKGTPQILTALASGEVSVAFPPTSSAVPQVISGKVRALGVTGKQRSLMAPDIGTVAENGLPGYEASTWYCMLVPARTPVEIISRLNGELNRVLQRADVKSRFAGTDVNIQTSTPDQLGAFMRAETAKLGKVVKALAMRPN